MHEPDVERSATRDSSPGYQLFMLVLCVFALIVLVLEAVFPPGTEMGRLLDYADVFICLFFLCDFVLSLWRAPNRWRYLATWGWVDLLSSIPRAVVV
jgi:voltage-gated potassium channel